MSPFCLFTYTPHPIHLKHAHFLTLPAVIYLILLSKDPLGMLSIAHGPHPPHYIPQNHTGDGA